jgi:hypothetical protein
VHGIVHRLFVLQAFVSAIDGFLGVFHQHWEECPRYFVGAEIAPSD